LFNPARDLPGARSHRIASRLPGCTAARTAVPLPAAAYACLSRNRRRRVGVAV